MSHSPLRALIVEDDPTTILLLVRVLGASGFEVAGTAINGEEAIEVYRQTRPDFVLMDYNMPVMDGIEATRRISAEAAVPIIMLTANTSEDNLEAALEAGACCYVTKPVTSTELILAVEQALSDNEAESA